MFIDEQILLLKTGKTAIICENKSVSYIEIYQMCEKIKSTLVKKYNGNNRNIIILMDKCIEQIVLQLSLMSLGLTFIPIDSECPEFRIQQVITSCNAGLIISKQDYLDIKSLADVLIPVFTFEELLDSNSREVTFTKYVRNLEDVAYIIYTSGSSGKSKGVMIKQLGLVNYITNVTKYCDYNDTSVILSLSPVGFDAYLHEVYCALTVGGTIVLHTRAMNISAMFHIMIQKNVTDIIATATLLKIVVQYINKKVISPNNGIRSVMFMGESCPVDIVTVIHSLFPSSRLIQGYGPTEFTIGCIFKKFDSLVPSSFGYLPLGKVLGKTEAYLITDDNVLADTDEIAQLYLSGDQLMAGYCNDPVLTSEVIVKNPAVANKCLYKTGDYMIKDKKGDYIFVGRRDDMIKINGALVYFSEIEKQARECDIIREAYAVSYLDDNDFTNIALFIILEDDQISEVLNIVVRFLKNRLPAYMYPSKIIHIKQHDLKITKSNKIDKQYLKKLI